MDPVFTHLKSQVSPMWVVSRRFESPLCPNGDRRCLTALITVQLNIAWLRPYLCNCESFPSKSFFMSCFHRVVRPSYFISWSLPLVFLPVFVCAVPPSPVSCNPCSLSHLFDPATPLSLRPPHVSPPPAWHNKCIDQHVEPLHNS